MGGGLPAGSSTLFIGPAGVGKSTAALQFAMAAAARGERAAAFIFDETVATLRIRARKMHMPLDPYLDQGLVTVKQVDPAELSPGEFVAIVRRAVEGTDHAGKPAKMIMIDSLNGYLHSMAEERQLGAQLHELLTYLSQRGVSTLLTVTQSGLIGTHMDSPIDTTYLADNVILFRYFEAAGHIRRAVSVAKRRSGAHEHSIREMTMGPHGIEIGRPLDQFEGILTGVPRFVGNANELLARGGNRASDGGPNGG
jgi:circadian clock protein KaiC